jgi:folate-binding protein YgfZ
MEGHSKVFSLESWKLLKITGIDSTRYLQGRLTQDIKALEQEPAVESLLLSPQGKIMGQLVLFKVKETYFALAPCPEDQNGENLVQDLLRFKVADQIEIEASQKDVFFSRKEALSILDEEKVNLPLRDIGFFLVGDDPKDAAEQSEFFNLCVAKGYPVFGRDFKNSHTAGVLNLEKFVSFTKGCYAGQEVVEKSVALGRVNKKLVQLHSTSSIDKKTPEAELFSDPEQTEVCGVLTSSYSHGSESWGFALLKNADNHQKVYSQGLTWNLVT